MFSLGSIAQNKIAGVITDGDGKKLTTVGLQQDNQHQSIYRCLALLNLILKKSGSFDFVFKEGYPL
jgi:Fe(3+) dicitrate transport protein